MQQWDYTTDFLVVGSGAGAMTAAIRAHDLGLDTRVIEKSEFFGGSSALSGGGLWIPNHDRMSQIGIPDSDADAMAYLRAITEGKVPDDKLYAYVTNAPAMIRYLEQHTAFAFEPLEKYCDYYPDQPGAKLGGRSGETRPFNAFRLGKYRKKLQPPPPQMVTFGIITATCREAYHASRGELIGLLKIVSRLLLWGINIPARLISKRSMRLTLGNGLVAPLLHALLKRNVPLMESTSLHELVVENGRVAGVIATQGNNTIRIQARKGVLLAAGGFERNAEMRKQYHRQPSSTNFTIGNLHNTGDAIRCGAAIGARLAFMDDAWWTPTVSAPGEPYAWILVCEKNMPHGIFVNGRGERFTNEAAPYIDVVNAMYDKQSADNCWMVFDKTFRQRQPVGRILPSNIMPDHAIPAEYWGSVIHKASSLAELAQKIDVSAAALEKTVARYNGFTDGKDVDFQRGESLQDQYYSAPKNKPNPTVGPIDKAPYYAARIVPGDIGTKGGLDTNANAQVMREDGSVIAGLYACGNCSSPVMGYSYAGAGSTLGPAMAFGFIAAQQAAAQD